MTQMKFLIAAAAATAAIPAAAAVTVIGSSAARSCYEAAESQTKPGRAAMEACDTALRHEPLTAYEIVATHVNRGILRLRTGEIEGAIADFDTAAARDPDEPEAYVNKGVALMQAPGRAEAAVSLFSMAIEKKTRRPAIAFLGRGMAHEELGDVRSAYHDYRKASAADPEWDQPRLELARFRVTRR